MNLMKFEVEQTMTLKEITDLLEVRHDNAMNIVAKMAENEDFGTAPKIKEQYTKGNNAIGEIETYQLNKRQSIAIASRLNTSLLMRIIDRWQELEQAQQLQLPQNYEEALEHLLVKVKENKVLEEKIEKDAPKVRFHDAVDVAENSIPVGVYSKILNIDGLGQNKLFAWFRDNKYLIDGGRRHNTPKQVYVNQGLFEVRESTVTKTNGEKMVVYTTLVTGKGQIYFEKLLNKGE